MRCWVLEVGQQSSHLYQFGFIALTVMLRSADPEQEHRRHETVSHPILLQWYRSSRIFFFYTTKPFFPFRPPLSKGLQSALNNNED